jgi:hypothetical protein
LNNKRVFLTVWKEEEQVEPWIRNSLARLIRKDDDDYGDIRLTGRYFLKICSEMSFITTTVYRISSDLSVKIVKNAFADILDFIS